jgi:hypothetical protein
VNCRPERDRATAEESELTVPPLVAYPDVDPPRQLRREELPPDWLLD